MGNGRSRRLYQEKLLTGESATVLYGSAMAAAAVDTIAAWLQDTDNLDGVDYIVTGDLGKIGYEICKQAAVGARL